MWAHSPSTFQAAPVRRASIAHRAGLALVWLSVVAGAVVFTEPAPVDVLVLGLVVLLPVIGLVRFTAGLLALVGAWLVIAALALVAIIAAIDPARALVHAAVTAFLALGLLTYAGFVMRNPERHARLLVHGYVVAAVLAALIGLIGYFGLLPGAAEIFTRYGRASATFKDPNVFGAFLVFPAAYLVHAMLRAPVRRGLLLAPIVGVVTLAILLSFSRGAWFNLALAVTLVVYLSILTAPTNRQRLATIAVAVLAVLAIVALLAVALNIEEVAKLYYHRASLSQGYDSGPEGRFGGQAKARDLILQNPFGIGPQQFAPHYHLEEPHNVYLALFLNSGWLGGLIHLAFTLLTLVWGLPFCFRRGATQGIFIAAFATLIGHLVEGYVIDLDHWRHYHLVLALLWGLMLSKPVAIVAKPDIGPLAFSPLLLGPSRPPRVMLPAPARIALRLPAPRRESGREDSRPSRAAGRTFGHNRP